MTTHTNTACKCQYCGAIGDTAHFVRVTLANRGGRSAYLCPAHATRYGDHGYHQRAQTATRGTSKAHGFTFGFELELTAPTAQMRVELANVGFMPTQDITTDTEFVSPVYQSMNPLPKKLETIHKLILAGEGAITDREGTHIHVGHVEFINRETNDYIARFYHSLFTPLSEAMRAEPARTEKLFGRNFNNWARPIDRYTDPREHTNFINLQHSRTIEFRLAKFITPGQFMNCFYFARDVAKTIINNFIKHFNDDNADRAYRLHKAQVTANKLVKLFYKYTD